MTVTNTMKYEKIKCKNVFNTVMCLHNQLWFKGFGGVVVTIYNLHGCGFTSHRKIPRKQPKSHQRCLNQYSRHY